MKNIRGLMIARPVLFVISVFLILIASISLLIFLFELKNTQLSFSDSLFTAFSASTVTGLTVISTNSLTLASQAAVLAAIQFGGLMTYIGAYIILSIAGMRGKSTAERLAQVKWHNIKTILILSFLVEALAATGYFFIFREEMSGSGAAYYAIFHAISAYCNAGFFLFSDNFISASPYIMGIAMAETVLGGLGFVLLTDLRDKLWAFVRRKRGPYFCVESRLMIFGTVAFILIGFFGFWALEFGGAIGKMSLGEGALVSLFQSVNARTAGFSAVDLNDLHNATYLLFVLLMFVGAGSGSIAGGVKITTLAIVVIATLFSLRGKSQVILWRSEVPPDNIYRARSVLIWYGIILFSLTFLLLIFESSVAFRDILFESLSAMGTVGLSTGITEKLSSLGKFTIMATMLVGRLSPLALTYLFSNNILSTKADSYTHKEVINVG